jgi:AP-1-like factor
MDFAMQALCLPEDVYDERSDINDPSRTSSWPSGFSSITGDRRSLSDVSNLSRMPSSANSIASEAVTPSTSLLPSEDATAPAATKPKRRRENRYKNAPPAVISRRRAQNRASQRAYRERKDQRIRDLEDLLEEAHRKEETLTQAFQTLQTEYDRLISDQSRAASLDGGPFSEHIFSSSELGGDGTGGGSGVGGSMSGFEFLDGVQNADMLAGLYLQHDRSAYPPII